MSSFPPPPAGLSYVRPVAYEGTGVMVPPPRLHWGWVLALSAITLSLFGRVWLVVQAHWVKKVSGNAQPFGWALAYLLWFPMLFVIGFAAGVYAKLTGSPLNVMLSSINLFGRLTSLLFYLVAVFQVSFALEAVPIRIPMGAWMTFFFGPIYFQYHLMDYDREDAAFAAAHTVGLGLGGAAPVVAPGDE